MQNTEILAPVSTEAQSISEAAEIGRQIGANWQKATKEVLDTAGLCDAAFRRHGSQRLPAVLRAAQMSRSTFMKLVVIGRDQRLRRIEALLPPNFSIIYQVSRLNEEIFEEAVKAEVIHPNVRRTEIEALRKPSESSGKVAKLDHDAELPVTVREIAAGVRFELMVPQDIGAAACAQMRQIVHGLQKKFGVEIASLAASQTAANGVVMPPVSSGSGSSPVNNRPLVSVHPAAAPKVK
jgi:hypothetical protein